MPRRRTIFCNHCGYAQLKSDNTCAQCGEMTSQGKTRLLLWIAGVLVVVVTGGLTVMRVEAILSALAFG